MQKPDQLIPGPAWFMSTGSGYITGGATRGIGGSGQVWEGLSIPLPLVFILSRVALSDPVLGGSNH